jgi:hypothetical protein
VGGKEEEGRKKNIRASKRGSKYDRSALCVCVCVCETHFVQLVYINKVKNSNKRLNFKRRFFSFCIQGIKFLLLYRETKIFGINYPVKLNS